MNQEEFKQRLTHCVNCQKEFKYAYPLTLKHDDLFIINTTCPHCKHKLQIDLTTYRRPVIISYKSGDGTPPSLYTLELPDTVPSQQAE